MYVHKFVTVELEFCPSTGAILWQKVAASGQWSDRLEESNPVIACGRCPLA